MARRLIPILCAAALAAAGTAWAQQRRPAQIAPGFTDPGRMMQRGNATEIAPNRYERFFETGVAHPVPATPGAAGAEPREVGDVRFRDGEEGAPRGARAFLEVAGETADAAVYVDGRMLGKTPLRKAEVAPGERKVRVAKYGFKGYETTVVAEPGKTARLEVTLQSLR